MTRGRAEAAHQAHNLEVAGSSPAPASNSFVSSLNCLAFRRRVFSNFTRFAHPGFSLRPGCAEAGRGSAPLPAASFSQL